MRRAIPFLLLLFILASNLIYAQFRYGDNVAGAHLGLSPVGSSFTMGLDYERAITHPGEVGPGVIGIGAIFDYFSYTETFYYSGSWTYTSFGVSGMYHFILNDTRWDPFVGLILGYEVASWKWEGQSYFSTPSAGGFTFGGSAGIRYYFSNSIAAQARVGFGFYVLALGIDFKF